MADSSILSSGFASGIFSRLNNMVSIQNLLAVESDPGKAKKMELEASMQKMLLDSQSGCFDHFLQGLTRLGQIGQRA